jgi:hypothetical protein
MSSILLGAGVCQVSVSSTVHNISSQLGTGTDPRRFATANLESSFVGVTVAPQLEFDRISMTKPGIKAIVRQRTTAMSVSATSAIRNAAALLLVAILGLAGLRGASPVSIISAAPTCACCKAVATGCAPTCCAPQQPDDRRSAPVQPTTPPIRSGSEWSIPAFPTFTISNLALLETQIRTASSELPHQRVVPIFQRDCSYLI